MNRFVKALLVSSAVTGLAYLIWSRLSTSDGNVKVRLVPPAKEVELDRLPEDLRKELLAELDEQMQ